AAVPALADVRAGGLLADGVELVALDHALQLEVARSARRADLEPRRLALPIGPHLAHVEDARSARVGAGAGAHAGTASGVSAAADSRRSGETIRCRRPSCSARCHAIRLR